MQINDILKFNKDKYFGGAVQANWFYDEEKVGAIADSYVFHGPKFHGINEQQWQSTSYKLNDTATYALKLSKKATEKESNRFCMTIAGYGTGKSHLSVALAALLSGHDIALRQRVLNNISVADRQIGELINVNLHKNLVIVLNGMRDFNLNSEMLSSAKKALSQHGLSSNVFDEITTQYRQAAAFCRNTFKTHKARYEHYLQSDSLSLESIVQALNNADKNTYNAVNEVYNEFMGTYIHTESDVSASDVLSLLVRKFCIEQNKFDRIYILFDEFGRYIEFTANNPQLAGDSSLQQIFEVVQNTDSRIVFDAFIQSDLNSYIRRVESSGSNIARYVGRYENSEKFYLSSNFETVLANLIEKKNERSFENIVTNNIENVYEKFHRSLFNNLCRWASPEINKRYVWINERMYFDVIAKGCYPVHPITVWFLANTSSWMQQRSTIAYTAEMFESIQFQEVRSKWLPYIYPVDIIGSGLFAEMLSSEEKGFVLSQNCMTYQMIITKLNGKITDNAVKVLRAILICNILKFKFYDRSSAMLCLKICSGLSDEEIEKAVAMLENDHCVISFNADINRFDLNAEAHGKQEYMFCVSKKIMMLRNYDPIEEIDEELLNELSLHLPVSTSFSQENSISSAEWQYTQMLTSVSKVNEMYCRSLLSKIRNAVDGESFRGVIVYLYCGKNDEQSIKNVVKLIKDLELQKLPIVFFLLRDDDEKWIALLKRRMVYRKFAESEKEMYARFLKEDTQALKRNIASQFFRMTEEKFILTDKGTERLTGRISQYCCTKFKEIYPCAIPFSVAEFEKKVTPAAKKILLGICRNMFSGTMCNRQSYQGLDPTEKRRIVTALHTSTPATSWQVFDSNYNLCEPRNANVKKLYHDIMSDFTEDSQHTIGNLFSKARYAPYGLNYYSLFLFIIYVLSFNIRTISLYDGTDMLNKQMFIDKYLSSDKKMLDNLFKVRVVIKKKTDDETLLDLIKEIKQLTYTERCSEFSKSLKLLTESSDNIETVRGDIAVCELKLQQGIKTNSALYGTITKAEKAVEQCKKTFNLIQIISLLSGVKKAEIDSRIDEYSEFMYSPTYCLRVEKILAECEKLFDENFSPFIANLKCSYSQSSEFKKRYTKAAKQLQEIGKKEYASLLKKCIDTALQEAELEQKYASTIAEARRFISSVDQSVHTLDFLKCEEITAQTLGWLQTFSTADDMASAVKERFISELNDVLEKVKKQNKDLECQVHDILQEIESPKDSISHLSERISKVLRLSPEEKYVVTLTYNQQLIEEFNKLKASIVQADKSVIERLEADYNNKWQGTVCDVYMEELIVSLKNNLAEKRNDWLKKNLFSIKTAVNTMTVSQCVQWQGVISELPEFLTDEDLAEITDLSAIVTEKIKTQKINGIIEMFMVLSDEEKTECLRKLNVLSAE